MDFLTTFRPDRNLLHIFVTPLPYSNSCQEMSTSKSGMYAPSFGKCPELVDAECWIIFCEELTWRSPLTEHQLKFYVWYSISLGVGIAGKVKISSVPTLLESSSSCHVIAWSPCSASNKYWSLAICSFSMAWKISILVHFTQFSISSFNIPNVQCIDVLTLDRRKQDIFLHSANPILDISRYLRSTWAIFSDKYSFDAPSRLSTENLYSWTSAQPSSTQTVMHTQGISF